MNKWKFTLYVFVIIVLFGCCNKDSQEWIEQKYTNIFSKFILIDGKRVHYRDEGEGDVIVLIHGTASSLHAWDKWAKELKNNYRVIRMDLPGFGLTGHEEHNQYEIKHDLEFLSKLTHKLGISSSHLVGSSLGGRIAWEYSLQHPESVISLTLINSLGYPQKKWPPGIELAQWPLLDKVMENGLPKFIYKYSLKDIYHDDKLITDKLINRYYELSNYKSNKDAFIKRVKASLDKDWHKIKEIITPTLILWGEEDIYFPVENAFRFNNEIKNSSIVIYPHVGHLPMEEVPMNSLKDFRAFITSISN